jgi:hypothetical protein
MLTPWLLLSLAQLAADLKYSTGLAGLTGFFRQLYRVNPVNPVEKLSLVSRCTP